VFSTAPLGWAHWVEVVLAGMVVGVAVGIEKRYRGGRDRRLAHAAGA